MNKYVLTVPAIHQLLQNQKILRFVFAGCLALFIAVNILLDYMYTVFQNSVFYISESFLFSASYWGLFFPLLAQLSTCLKKTEVTGWRLMLPVSAIIFHLLAYPAVVWGFSRIFYEHTFPYEQTFNFALSAYFIKTVLVYGFFSGAIIVLKSSMVPEKTDINPGEANDPGFIQSVMVSDLHQKLRIAVDDILYFSANSPYVNIHHPSKKYLHTGTLKLLETQLDNTKFIRIHKSCIVNLQKVISYKSRLNGDYDASLSDGTVVRISRNYASDFKTKFENIDQ